MKFKIGDKVKFIGDYSKHSIHFGKKLEDFIKENKNVLYVSAVTTAYMQVKGSTCWCFHDGELELVDYTYEDLKKSPIGTKITFENGAVLVKDEEDSFENISRSRNITHLCNLKDKYNSLGEIIKIEEPEYKTVYESKSEILDEAEKRYLRNFITPFKNSIETIRRLYSPTKKKDYIQIRYRDDRPTNFPYFESNTMYKGMELNKNYTLEELGL